MNYKKTYPNNHSKVLEFQIESMLNTILNEENDCSESNEFFGSRSFSTINPQTYLQNQYQQQYLSSDFFRKNSFSYPGYNSFFYSTGNQFRSQMNFIQNNNIYNHIDNVLPKKTEMILRRNQSQNEQMKQKEGDGLIEELIEITKDSDKIDYSIYKKIQSRLLVLIKSQKGSRIIQKYLKNTQNEIIHQIFMQIKPYLIELMKDPYANYFCKKLFSYLNQKERIDFLLSIQSKIPKLCKHKVATYPIQGVIEEVGSKLEKTIIVNSIQNLIQELCFDAFGAHVIEKIFGCFEEEFILPILNYVKNNFLLLANNVNGICVVKKVLTMFHKKTLHEELKELTKKNIMSLIQNPYGKYVIQVILDNWDDKEVIDLLSPIENNYSFLSMQKHSSNIIEKIIEKNEYFLNSFVNEICNKEMISDTMRDNYGNYVVQKALKISKGEIKVKLAMNVGKNISQFNDKKLIAKWKRLIAN